MIAGIETDIGHACDPDHAPFRGVLSFHGLEFDTFCVQNLAILTQTVPLTAPKFKVGLVCFLKLLTVAAEVIVTGRSFQMTAEATPKARVANSAKPGPRNYQSPTTDNEGRRVSLHSWHTAVLQFL